MKKESKKLSTVSSSKISEKILHSPTVMKDVDYCRIESEKNEGENGMRDVVRNEVIIVEILKECNWWERIIVKRLENLIIKVYYIARINTVNKFIEK